MKIGAQTAKLIMKVLRYINCCNVYRCLTFAAMKVERIEALGGQFAQFLMDFDQPIDMSKYEAQESWATHWDLDVMDLSEVYDASLSSKTSGSLWGGSADSAKAFVLEAMAANREMVRVAFVDLFKDEKDLGLRSDRFVHHMEELARELSRGKPRKVAHRHDRKMVAFYLSMRYPERYALWDWGAFAQMMGELEARVVPSEVEFERYFKSLRGIYKVMTTRVPELSQAMAVRMAGTGLVYRPSLLLMNDFMAWVQK